MSEQPDRTKGTVKEVETLYKASSSSDDHSPPELDRAILEASRRAVRFRWLDALLDKTRLHPIASGQLLAAMTLGALIGVGLDIFFNENPESVPTDMIHAGDPPAYSVKDQDPDTRSPESWLKLIAALLLEGRTTEAEAELRAFRHRYPDYQDTAHRKPRSAVP